MAKKLKKKEPRIKKRKTAYDEQLYENARIADLILFAMLSLKGSAKKSTFENLIEECFILFPKAVNFFCHPRWPDSRRIDRPLRTLRKQGLIMGNPKDSFVLTKEGEKIAQEIIKKLRQGKLL